MLLWCSFKAPSSCVVWNKWFEISPYFKFYLYNTNTKVQCKYQSSKMKLSYQGGHYLPPSTFLRSKMKKGKQRKKERVSKQKILKGCHQSQDVTVLDILECLEWKNVPCQSTMRPTIKDSMAPQLSNPFRQPCIYDTKDIVERFWPYLLNFLKHFYFFLLHFSLHMMTSLQNNDHARIKHKKRFRSSFKNYAADTLAIPVPLVSPLSTPNFRLP